MNKRIIGFKGNCAVPAQWLSSSSNMSGRAAAVIEGAVQSLAQPTQFKRLRQLLLLLLALWALFACVQLIWALVPNGDIAPPPAKVINPVSAASSAVSSESVDIDEMRGWHLFGEAGSKSIVAVIEPEVTTSAGALKGIEKGARETRLKLLLRGIVASTEDGLGHAIIEYQRKQDVYAVEDKLPVPGRVMLAKVMPKQVVLDNGGTYELLVLFEESPLEGQQSASPVTKSPATRGAIDKRGDEQATSLAASYRQRLYKDPQSLAKVVNIRAVREGDALLGYRVSPGQEKAQFEQLGFKPGDLVTAVNGIELSDPSNTMQLYSAMRSAGEVEFQLERDNAPFTLSVSLGDGAQ